MSLKLFTPGMAVGLLLWVPAGAAAVVATIALGATGIGAVADDVLALAVAAGKDLDDHAQDLPKPVSTTTGLKPLPTRDLLAFAQEMLGRLRPVLGLPPVARPLARLARIVGPMFGPPDMGEGNVK